MSDTNDTLELASTPRASEGPNHPMHTMMDTDTVSNNHFLPSPAPLVQQTPAQPSSDHILAGLLREAHFRIAELDRRIQKQYDEKMELLDRLNRRDLEVMARDNTIDHLRRDLREADARIESLEKRLKEVSDNPPADELPRQIHHTQNVRHPVIWDMFDDEPMLLSISPTTHSSGLSSRNIIPYAELPFLLPDGYSWYSLPDHQRLRSPGLWRYVPIPGQFFPDDFSEGMTLSGRTWTLGRDELRRS